MATDSKVPEVGKRAPAFTLPAYPEGKVRLSEFKGEKNVLLYFYPKDNTPGCTTESCDFRDRVTTFKKNDTVIKEYKLTLRDITLKKRLSFIKDKSSGKIETIISQLLNSSNTYSLDVLNGYQHSTDHHFIEKKHLNKFWDFLFPLFQVLVVINEE